MSVDIQCGLLDWECTTTLSGFWGPDMNWLIAGLSGALVVAPVLLALLLVRGWPL